MKQKIVKYIKILVFLFIFSCMGSFIYYSISVSFPVFKIDRKPSVITIFNLDENNVIKPDIHVTSFTLYNKFGPQSVLNPIYRLAQSLFYKPTKFMLCLDYAGGSLAFNRKTSQDWATQFGWTYSLDTPGRNTLIVDSPKDRIISEALLVNGECTEDYDDNKTIAKYDVQYRVPDLDSFSSSPLMNVTFNQALQEANTRIKLDAGYTQINVAIRNNCLVCVKSLLSKGVNANGPVSGGKSIRHPKQKSIESVIPPLRLAMKKNRYEIFVYLLDQGARDKLVFAAKKDWINYFSLQIENGSDINEKDNYGRTALEISITNQCFECLKLLVSKGAIINAVYRKQTPLNMALRKNNFKITKYLLDHGAKKDLIGNGNTAYDVVKRTDIVKDKRIMDLFKD